ncbi:class I SAM-dependent methyltransferase [Rhodoblastus sp.]|uniref:class I SAM-dependent methyltransferase n=1 Tax=Rhodoblastus sp. TaxID=1962975 RepID=UPI003F9E494A
MDAELCRRLDALPPLDRRYAQTNAVKCKICGSESHFAGSTDFWKCGGGHPFGRSGVPVYWYSCPRCEFLFTDFFDTWSSIEFSKYIYNSDYIKVDPDYGGTRSERVFESLKPFLLTAPGARVLDYGGGSGVLSKLLREVNIDAVSYDPFSSPDLPGGEFDIIVCVEVLEHSPEPARVIQDMVRFLAQGGCIILGISLHPQNIKQLGPAWWYCAPRNGHCSTFSASTLATLGRQLGLSFHFGRNAHWCAWRRAGQPSQIARMIGPAFECLNLAAPKDNRPGWHGLERNFRWSGADVVEWSSDIAEAPALVRVKLLFHMEPSRGFAEKCKLHINGREYKVTPNAFIDIELDNPGRIIAWLENSTLICPAEHGSKGQRRLGLALLVE